MSDDLEEVEAVAEIATGVEMKEHWLVAYTTDGTGAERTIE